MINLTTLYKAILEFVGLRVTSDNYVSVGDSAITIESRRLTMPVTAHLRQAGDGKIYFHPLCESKFQTSSPIFDFYRKAVNVRLNTLFALLGTELLNIAVNTDQHNQLTPDQHQFLSEIGVVSEKTYKAFTATVTSSERDIQRSYLNIYIRNGGVFQKEKYPRLAVCTFEAYKTLVEMQKALAKAEKGTKPKLTLIGVNLDKKDVGALINLYRYILPEIDDEEGYNCGSRCDIAPGLCSLLFDAAKIAGRFNDIIRLFSNRFTAQIEELDLSWTQWFADESLLVTLKREQPTSLFGNSGSIYTTTNQVLDTAATISVEEPQRVKVQEPRVTDLSEPDRERVIDRAVRNIFEDDPEERKPQVQSNGKISLDSFLGRSGGRERERDRRYEDEDDGYRSRERSRDRRDDRGSRYRSERSGGSSRSRFGF